MQPLSTIEQAARLAWRAWGEAYALNTICSGCGHFKPCRGKKRSHMLCLTCWDMGVK